LEYGRIATAVEGLLVFLFVKRVAKQTSIIIEEYHLYQVYNQEGLFGIISVHFTGTEEVLITICIHQTLRQKTAVQWDYTPAIYQLQELRDLRFSWW
jgi:hypothetical protein